VMNTVLQRYDNRLRVTLADPAHTIHLGVLQPPSPPGGPGHVHTFRVYVVSLVERKDA
jgi:hypothetical protein